MNKLLKNLIPVACLAGPAAPLAAAEAPAADLPPSQIVTATLLADTTAAQPNTTITVGIHYKIAPGWHIYWKNPGASGLATKVDWALPEGMSLGETQYPAPIMFESPGPIVSYGYEGEVLLLMETRTPATVGGDLVINAKSRWLMCSDRCIPGKQDLTLTIPAGSGQPANRELFDRFRAMVPRKVNATPGNVMWTSVGGGNKTSFNLKVSPPEGAMLVGEDNLPDLRAVYFFPEAQDGWVFEGGETPAPDAQATVDGKTIKAYKGPVEIKYTLEASGGDSSKPRNAGVLVYQTISADGKADKPELLDMQIP